MSESLPAAPSLHIGDDETVTLEGDLCFESVAMLYREMQQRLPQCGPVRAIDLSRVRQVDSAGLALLLEWQARQRSRGVALAMTGAPDNLLRLARLCEAVDMLRLSGRESSS